MSLNNSNSLSIRPFLAMISQIPYIFCIYLYFALKMAQIPKLEPSKSNHLLIQLPIGYDRVCAQSAFESKKRQMGLLKSHASIYI